jgi:hypothetical protein
MLTYKNILFLVLALMTCVNGCADKKRIAAPNKISEKKMTNIMSGAEAVQLINNLHGHVVAPEENIIAEYGEDPKDILYISLYEGEDQATKAINLMITGMMNARTGTFSHLHALPNYKEKVYISIGMGAIHYIYRSSRYVLWLQTYQDIGRELPEELTRLYPI